MSEKKHTLVPLAAAFTPNNSIPKPAADAKANNNPVNNNRPLLGAVSLEGSKMSSNSAAFVPSKRGFGTSNIVNQYEVGNATTGVIGQAQSHHQPTKRKGGKFTSNNAQEKGPTRAKAAMKERKGNNGSDKKDAAEPVAKKKPPSSVFVFDPITKKWVDLKSKASLGVRIKIRNIPPQITRAEFEDLLYGPTFATKDGVTKQTVRMEYFAQGKMSTLLKPEPVCSFCVLNLDDNRLADDLIQTLNGFQIGSEQPSWCIIQESRLVQGVEKVNKLPPLTYQDDPSWAEFLAVSENPQAQFEPSAIIPSAAVAPKLVSPIVQHIISESLLGRAVRGAKRKGAKQAKGKTSGKQNKKTQRKKKATE